MTADLGPCEPAQRTNASGYGVVFRDGKERRAHRVAWEDENGPIPAGQEVRHKCDNPPCCRLDHLTLGTHAENMADAVERGRIAKGERNARTRLTDQEVREIRQRRAAGETCAVLAAAYGVNNSTIARIGTGERRGDVV